MSSGDSASDGKQAALFLMVPVTSLTFLLGVVLFGNLIGRGTNGNCCRLADSFTLPADIVH